MAKLTLKPSSTFKATVDIPIHSGGSAPVIFTFKHHKKSKVKKIFEEAIKITDDAEYLLEFVEGWDIEDEFNKTNLQELIDNYMGAVVAIMNKYMEIMQGIREKN